MYFAWGWRESFFFFCKNKQSWPCDLDFLIAWIIRNPKAPNVQTAHKSASNRRSKLWIWLLTATREPWNKTNSQRTMRRGKLALLTNKWRNQRKFRWISTPTAIKLQKREGEGRVRAEGGAWLLAYPRLLWGFRLPPMKRGRLRRRRNRSEFGAQRGRLVGDSAVLLAPRRLPHPWSEKIAGYETFSCVSLASGSL